MTTLQLKVDEFLKEAAQFQLGDLPTESSHPKTVQLSQLAKKDILKAIQVFKDVEVTALEVLLKHAPQIEDLKLEIEKCLRHKGRIFFCGCGATGRLSISLETNWRESLQDSPLSESVFGFIAGGDYALVKSIENFEDHPEYGERQLMELGFSENDLLISCTEGGETPFVIGATLIAAKLSKWQTHFLFCNPKESLRKIERSQSIFRNSRITSVSLATGPQAICGSTRLQASSILYMACGIALFAAQAELLSQKPRHVLKQIQNYIDFLKTTDFSSLRRLIELESQSYLKNQFLTYHLVQDPMPILTDLTERSPTFNLLPVENSVENSKVPATANLCIESATDSKDAWKQILLREARALNWHELQNKFDFKVMLGFDFSNSKNHFRETLVGKSPHVKLHLDFKGSTLQFTLNGETLCSLEIPTRILERNLLLKFVFNLVSTLAQCQNSRVLGNIMLYVKPSNKKLIDRAARFTKMILRDQYQLESRYEDLVDCVFLASENLSAEESVVLKSVDVFLKKYRK